MKKLFPVLVLIISLSCSAQDSKISFGGWTSLTKSLPSIQDGWVSGGQAGVSVSPGIGLGGELGLYFKSRGRVRILMGYEHKNIDATYDWSNYSGSAPSLPVTAKIKANYFYGSSLIDFQFIRSSGFGMWFSGGLYLFKLTGTKETSTLENGSVQETSNGPHPNSLNIGVGYFSLMAELNFGDHARLFIEPYARLSETRLLSNFSIFSDIGGMVGVRYRL